MVVNLVTTANKLENERLEKLRNLTDAELDDYIEKLVLDAYKGINNNGVVENPDMDVAIDKLNEITDITLKKSPGCNIKAVIKDRKFRYMNLAYVSAIYNMEHLRTKLINHIDFTADITELELYHYYLKNLLRIYYGIYFNYNFMENLLMDLSDDGLSVDSDIRDKYVYSKEYGYNQKAMVYLDADISVIVKLILKKIAELDEKYLVDHDDAVNDCIDEIHSNITDFYKNNSDFEISVYKQIGLLNSELDIIKSVKDDFNKNLYLEIKEKLLTVIDGNGFSDLSANRYNKLNPGVDFDEWMEKEPKYDVRNSKFIYPQNTNC